MPHHFVDDDLSAPIGIAMAVPRLGAAMYMPDFDVNG
jgi:hypothetical protein